MAGEGQDILYQPGISYTNPKVVRVAAPVRSNPWFWEEKGVGPLSASSKLRKWDGNTPLKKYKAVWNRGAKQRNVQKLGAYFHDVPTMNELGEAPPATAETSTTTRGPLGFLENLISVGQQAATGITDVLQKREVQKTQAALAQSRAYNVPFFGQFNVGGDSTWLWIAGIGAVAVGGYFLFSRR